MVKKVVMTMVICLVEILVRLPIHIVFRLTCISKRWYSIISHPSFASIYVSHASKFNPRFLLLLCAQHVHQNRPNNSSPTPATDLVLGGFLRDELPLGSERATSLKGDVVIFASTPESLKQYEIAASSNGLLLLVKGDIYYVCKFVTREIADIPMAPRLKINLDCAGFITQMKGPLVDRFRIVLVRTQKLHLIFHVYTSETASWSDQKFIFNLPVNWNFRIPNFAFKGHLHWVHPKAGILAYDPFSHNIQYRILKFPTLIRVSLIDICCNVSREHIRLVETSRYEKICRIWRLEDYEKEEWCLEHIITLDWTHFIKRTSFYFTPLVCDPIDPEIVHFWELCSGEFSSFNFRTRKLSFNCIWKSKHYKPANKMVLPTEIPVWPSPIPAPSLEADTRRLSQRLKRKRDFHYHMGGIRTDSLDDCLS